jgi:hypothetical protein
MNQMLADHVKEVMARLDFQAAIIAECRMLEALASLQASDEQSPEYEPTPEDWNDYREWADAVEWRQWLARVDNYPNDF